MATAKKEKGVILNSRGTYEVRLGGKYYGSRKTLKEANGLSLDIQTSSREIQQPKPKKKQSVVTGRKNKTTAVKKTLVIMPPKTPCPCEVSVTHIQRLEEQPKKKSFWQFLKDMFK